MIGYGAINLGHVWLTPEPSRLELTLAAAMSKLTTIRIWLTVSRRIEQNNQ